VRLTIRYSERRRVPLGRSFLMGFNKHIADDKGQVGWRLVKGPVSISLTKR
jgi:hypothetical protein